MLDRLFRASARTAQAAAWVSGAALFAAAMLVTGDVLSRKLLGVTMAGSDEIAGYVLAITSSWAYAYCLLQRSHVRIDVAYNLVPLKARCLLDIAGLVALLAFVAMLTYRAVGVLAESVSRGAVSNTSLTVPLWIPQSLWVGGLVFFTATLCVATAHTIALLGRREYSEIRRVAGIPTVVEEIATETGGIEKARRPAATASWKL